MQKRNLIALAIMLSLVQLSFAQAISSDTVLDLIKDAMGPAISRLTSTAISWLGVFAVIQFVITNYGVLKSDGDIQTVIAKLFASLTWIGVCLYIINNGPDFIQGVGDEMMGIVGFQLPSASGIITQTVKISAVVATVAVGASITPGVGDTIGQLLLYIAIGLLVVGLLFAFKVFMLQLELGLIALLAPLSFAFLGLSTLKDQGIAPFKSLLSFTYRVIILTVILSAFGKVSDAVVDTLSSISAATIIANGLGNIVDTVLAAMGAYLLLAFLVWKSDGIASSMASGSTSLGNSDIASAAAAGAAAGAVVASAGAAAAGGAAQAPQSMANFMSGLNGGGSIKNAGGMGGGGSPAPFVPPASPSMSRTGTTGGSATGGGSTGSTPSAGATAGSKGSSASGSSAGMPAKPKGSGSGSVASGRYGSTSTSNTASAASSGNSGTAHSDQGAQSSDAQNNDSSIISNGSDGNENSTPESQFGNNSAIEAQSNAQNGSQSLDSESKTAGAKPENGSSVPSGKLSQLPGAQATNSSSAGAPKGSAAAGSGGGANRAFTANSASPTSASGSAPDDMQGQPGADAGAHSPSAPQPGSDAMGDEPTTTQKHDGTTSLSESSSQVPAAPSQDLTVKPASAVGGASAATGSSSSKGNSAGHASNGVSQAASGNATQAHQARNTAPGSASTAAISSDDKMQQTLDQIANALATQGPKKPTLKDHLGEANRQVERERDTTTVHINTHNSD
ncbi:hypothetical protein [Comamonas testosteroni]|jgi:type IV secretion system protein TrbL|uniref:hypothetical protein n=1 Tax=Comamonas testosteroni TaxID=285 RepID=UPI0026EBB273|nr:hypothetical protein [Comamonas testosteroni]